MEDNESTEQIIREGEIAKKTALEYVDWLVITVNEAIPDQIW